MSINAPESGPPEIRSYLRFFLSGWGDLNSRPSVPQTDALTKLRHSPRRTALYRSTRSCCPHHSAEDRLIAPLLQGNCASQL